PIQYALTYPRRLPGISPPLSIRQEHQWELIPADRERFPALELGFEVARVGGTAGAVVNAANEQAVELFLEGHVPFTDIVRISQLVLSQHTHETTPSLGRLLELDDWARKEARRCGELGG
ncbi:MAG: 1-deoxy-D-xylulose-5-phosphate reductoisomerase, partial [Planctomycetota bacterium]